MERSPRKESPLNPFKISQMIFHFPKFIKIFGRLMKDGRVPWYAKAMPVLAIAYVISPIDLIPGLLVPILGGVDDLIAIFLGLKGLVAFTPYHIVAEHISRIERGL